MAVGVRVGGDAGPEAVLTEVVSGTTGALVAQTHDGLPFAALAAQRVLNCKSQLGNLLLKR